MLLMRFTIERQIPGEICHLVRYDDNEFLSKNRRKQTRTELQPSFAWRWLVVDLRAVPPDAAGIAPG